MDNEEIYLGRMGLIMEEIWVLPIVEWSQICNGMTNLEGWA